MLPEVSLKLLLALLLGAALGLEREGSHKENPQMLAGGSRTFALLSLLGSLAGLLLLSNQPLAFALICSASLILLVVKYVVMAIQTKDYGMTTEFALVFTFVLGLMLSLQTLPVQVLVSLTVIVLLILAFKEKSKELVSGISRQELQGFVSYAIVALVILPFLPNVSYTISDISFLQGFAEKFGQFANLEIINPKHIWLVVVLITGIDVLGHALARIFGRRRGLAITSFSAGFISSTSATQSLASQSKTGQFISYLAGAAVLANLASFIQIAILIAPLNSHWFFYYLAPALGLMVLVAGIFCLWYFNAKNYTVVQNHHHEQERKIFALWPAVRFALLLIVIKIVTKVCLLTFGQVGFLASSIIASLTGVDAILVNLADMAGKTITFQFAFFTFLSVNATNLISKVVYSYISGNKKFANRLLLAVIFIITASCFGILFIK